MKLTFFFLLSCSLLLLLLSAPFSTAYITDTPQTKKKLKKVNITKWHMCEGCKLAVYEFAMRISDLIESMKKKNEPIGTEVEITDLASSKELCSSKPYLRFWSKEVRFACMKLVGVSFLSSFIFFFMFFLSFLLRNTWMHFWLHGQTV